MNRMLRRVAMLAILIVSLALVGGTEANAEAAATYSTFCVAPAVGWAGPDLYWGVCHWSEVTNQLESFTPIAPAG